MSRLKIALQRESDTSSDDVPRRILQSKIMDSADFLHASRRRKEFVLGDLEQVENINHETQQKVQHELESLAKDTQSYEQKLRVMRQQLKLKESENKELYRKRIEEMNDEFHKLKETSNLYKLGLHLAKKDLFTKFKTLVQLKSRAFQRVKRRLKQQHLRARLVKLTLCRIVDDPSEGREFDFAHKVYLAKLKGEAMLALKASAYQSVLEALRTKINNTKPRVIELPPQEIYLSMYKACQVTIEPIFVQKVKRIQRKEKIKVVKRSRPRPPKINKNPQQIILKSPSPPPPQAVTIHLKVEANPNAQTTTQTPVKSASHIPIQTSHQHHKCHKSICQTHRPQGSSKSISPLKRTPHYGHIEDEQTPKKKKSELDVSQRIYGPYQRQSYRSPTLASNEQYKENFKY